MCLELLNQLLVSGLAWWALGMLAAIVVALALFVLLPASQPHPARPGPGFTCPCCAPPVSSTKDHPNHPDSA